MQALSFLLALPCDCILNLAVLVEHLEIGRLFMKTSHFTIRTRAV